MAMIRQFQPNPKKRDTRQQSTLIKLDAQLTTMV
jgi:hypothetical protein